MHPFGGQSKGADPGAEYGAQARGKDERDARADEKIAGQLRAFERNLKDRGRIGKGQSGSVEGQDISVRIDFDTALGKNRLSSGTFMAMVSVCKWPITRPVVSSDG